MIFERKENLLLNILKTLNVRNKTSWKNSLCLVNWISTLEKKMFNFVFNLISGWGSFARNGWCTRTTGRFRRPTRSTFSNSLKTRFHLSMKCCIMFNQVNFFGYVIFSYDEKDLVKLFLIYNCNLKEMFYFKYLFDFWTESYKLTITCSEIWFIRSFVHY